MMRRLLLLVCFLGVGADDSCIPLPSMPGPTAQDLPLCGNGVLDPGEVCDDGNRVGGDGCNAWCAGFDRMSRACTLAGQNLFYATQAKCLSSVSAFSPSEAFFCRLNAIAAAPDGSYLIVADGGLLVRMDLFTDAVMHSLTILPVTATYSFTRFCSLFIMPDGDTIVAHECAEQSIVVFTGGGTQFSKPVSLPFAPASSSMSRAFYAPSRQTILYAGASASSCADIYALNVSTWTGSIIASTGCVAYNVIENGAMYPSFSLDGMVPYQVTGERCPPLVNSASCYVVYMQRNDMHLLKAYVPVDGGLDVHFSVSTDDGANVLGSPLQFSTDTTTYSLIGNCFTAAAQSGKSPSVTLGNTCGLPGTPCRTPLNNPFITEIASSSYLLPQGLSSSMQHQTLLQIFAEDMPLYQQILDNAHNGTVPIDFVELPGTGDVVYITQTTVGLISLKGIVLMDIHNPGYCRATHAILCPHGYFGSVGTTCLPCSAATATATAPPQSVSAQMQCTGFSSGSRRRLLQSSFQSPPYTQMVHIVNKAVTQDTLNTLTNFYLLSKGFPCTTTGIVSGYQPYNMQADYLEAQMPLPPEEQQRVPQLIAQANARTGRNFSSGVSEEYMLAWSLPTSTLVDATLKYMPTPLLANAETCGISNVTMAWLQASPCRFLINKNFHRYWLPCAIQQGPAAQGRRLLQQAQSPQLQEHSQPAFMSNTMVSYGVSSSSSSSSNTALNTSGAGKAGNNDGGVALVILVSGVVGGVLVAILMVLVIYFACLRRAGGSRPLRDIKMA